MKLSDLDRFSDIVIQCHDNPDPDAVGSGFALYRYFSLQPERRVRLVYSGKYPVKKPNLLLMIDRLEIPLTYVEQLDPAPELLITVDCQHGEGNVTPLSGRTVAVIDHHPHSGRAYLHEEIRSGYGSCASVVYQLMRDAGFDPNEDIDVSTALYYGLYSDTNSLSEIAHPADRDLRDDVVFHQSLLLMLRNTNLSVDEISIAGEALNNAFFDLENRFAIAEADPCDPNILGFISDMLLQVNISDSCVVFCRLPFGIKYSVRSCNREIHAGEMAMFLADGIGSGGGHKEKAGGFLREDKIVSLADYETDAKLFRDRIVAYLRSYDAIYTEDFQPDITAMRLYRKRHLPLGYVRSLDVLAPGESAVVRTLEGDIDIRADEDIYIMIGILGEVYPIRREIFEVRYDATGENFRALATFEYDPTIKRQLTHESIRLATHARCCMPSDETLIYARPLTRTTKVFTDWDLNGYMLGKPGDYLAVRSDNPRDVYIIADDIFDKTYGAEQE